MSCRSHKSKERYQRRVKAHQCVNCSSPLEGSNKKRCLPCRAKSSSAALRWYRKQILAGNCSFCGKQQPEDSNKQTCNSCLTRASKAARRYGQKNRHKVFTHYGSKCACCGESEQSFLTLDHINGDGSAQRRSAKVGAGQNYYRHIIRQDFPKDLQLLCWNCNMSKHYLGQCAHSLPS